MQRARRSARSLRLARGSGFERILEHRAVGAEPRVRAAELAAARRDVGITPLEQRALELLWSEARMGVEPCGRALAPGARHGRALAARLHDEDPGAQGDPRSGHRQGGGMSMRDLLLALVALACGAAALLLVAFVIAATV